MSKIKWGAPVFAYVVTAMLAAGCGTTTNTNTNANGNTTVVNQNVNANVNANANANANANTRATNANVTREEYEKNKVSIMEEAKRLGPKIGIGAEDGWLWTKTRAALATAD